MQPFNKVTDHLFQGSVPDPGSTYDTFSMIVLCAEECQPELPRFPRKIIRPAFGDTHTPSNAEIDRARQAAAKVAAELLRGGTVLVTCAAGLNRSGLVSGFALVMTTRLSPAKIVELIRSARGEHALCNRTFVDLIFSAAAVRDQYLSANPDDRRKSASSTTRRGR